MIDHLQDDAAGAVPVTPVIKAGLDGWLDGQPETARRWVEAAGFKAAAGKHCAVPGADGAVERVLLGLGNPDDQGPDPWLWGGLPGSLASGLYRLEGLDGAADLAPETATDAALAWALGCYLFSRYRRKDREKTFARLVWPATADRARVEREAAGTILCRDLINTPANDMGPAELARAAKRLAAEFGGQYREIVGDDLLKENYPAIHAVGRAAGPAQAPRLIDIAWAPPGLADDAPRVALVGKGVCFDTGGLDLKPAAGMKTMKKDMGGAANVLGIARVLMAAAPAIHLRVLVPAVENSVSGNAMRPLDVVATRKGTTVEIANTDAEGRVILADALWEALSDKPDLIVDFATLTGAARVALGTELPALFCDDDALAEAILAAGKTVSDPLWRMPLWPGYAHQVEGAQADLTNAPEGGYGGAITAALFLKHFVTPENGDDGDGTAVPWVHVDLMAWNLRDRPGRPVGGEAMGLRAVARMILDRYEAG